MGERISVELPGQPASVRTARILVQQTLADWRLETAADTAVLLVSELATNAVLHANSGFRVELTRRDRVVRVAVADCSGAPPAPRRHGATAGTGRGLAMVATLATAWGTALDVRPYEKAVWFEVLAD